MGEIFLLAEGSLPDFFWLALMSSLKFILAVPASFIFGNSFLQTIIITSAGGITGVLVFFFLSRFLIFNTALDFSLYFMAFEQLTGLQMPGMSFLQSGRRFTRRNRMLDWMGKRYGLAGIILITPVVLSIPLGTIMVYRLSCGKSAALGMLAVSVIGWSLLLSAVIALF